MISVSDGKERFMNYEIIREEAASMQLVSSGLRDLSAGMDTGSGNESISERLMRDIQLLDQLSELALKYADECEKTESDICSFMRQKLSFRDPGSSLGDIIIEKDIKISDSAVISGKTLIHDLRTENAALVSLVSGYGEKNEQ